MSEWEEEAGAVGFDPALIPVSGFTHFKPIDNISFDEAFPSSGYMSLQYFCFFSFTLWGFSRASPTWLQENLQFQLILLTLAAFNSPNACLLLCQPCLRIWWLDMMLFLILHLLFCYRFLKSIHTPRLWGCALQSWWEQLMAPYPAY